MSARYEWFVHQPAVVGWVKRELATRRPDLRFAFSRPGLTTYKVADQAANAMSAAADRQPPSSSFARAWGLSLGRAQSPAEVLALARTWMAAHGLSRVRLHVFEREPDLPADERAPEKVGTRPRQVETSLRSAASELFLPESKAVADELVLDVITAPAESDDDGWLVGWHRHDAWHGPWPGGVQPCAIPPSAPSRAWAKIEEAIAWSDLVPRAGDNAVELGAAPGGACFALLERGLHVHGVDPGDIDPRVLNYRGTGGNRFVHHALPAAEVDKRALPRPMHWLLSDVNLAPMVALRYIERYAALGKGQLRGAFLTLKLNDDGVFEALPRLQARIAKLGARNVRYVQLPSHRSEIVAILAW